MKTICYDIISLHRQNLVLKNCPSCQSVLEAREVEPSQASRVFCQKAAKPVISTHAISCARCGWWVVREQRYDDALHHSLLEDFIVIDRSIQDSSRLNAHNLNKARKNLANRKSDTWKKILADQVFWEPSSPMSSTEAVQFFGPAQMLLPDVGSISIADVMDKLKALAPIIFPIVVIILFIIFSKRLAS